jgi:hypothetical protein
MTSKKVLNPSLRRKPASIALRKDWIPTFIRLWRISRNDGDGVRETFYETVKIWGEIIFRD